MVKYMNNVNSEMERPLELVRPEYQLLKAIPCLGSIEPPDEDKQATACFNAGTRHYLSAAYPKAADSFVEAASKWMINENNPYISIIIGNRLLAYKNAVYSWLMADRPDQAERVLHEAMKNDAACRDEIRELMAQLI